jgi:diguanylate cyclase (GGDEF)-like protein
VRFGGEEFAIFLPLTSSLDARVVAERIRVEVEALTTETDSGPVKVTISLGIAEHLPQESLSELIKKADTALYEAKETGRNRICIFSQQ